MSRIVPPTTLGTWFASLLRAARGIKKSTVAEQMESVQDLEEFEDLSLEDLLPLVTESFRLVGYQAFTGRDHEAAQHADVMLMRGGRKLLVRVREWQEFRVGKEPLYALRASMNGQQADRGVILTSGTFSTQARSLGQRFSIDLVEREEMLSMLRSAKRNMNSAIMPITQN